MKFFILIITILSLSLSWTMVKEVLTINQEMIIIISFFFLLITIKRLYSSTLSTLLEQYSNNRLMIYKSRLEGDVNELIDNRNKLNNVIYESYVFHQIVSPKKSFFVSSLDDNVIYDLDNTDYKEKNESYTIETKFNIWGDLLIENLYINKLNKELINMNTTYINKINSISKKP